MWNEKAEIRRVPVAAWAASGTNPELSTSQENPAYDHPLSHKIGDACRAIISTQQLIRWAKPPLSEIVSGGIQ